mgnify:CR=1 FL=1
MIEPISYRINKKLENKYRPETLKEFGISQQELEGKEKQQGHRFDHVRQNKRLAGLIRHSNDRLQFFKMTTLNKNHNQNLEIIKN